MRECVFPMRTHIEIAEHHDPVSRVKNPAGVDVAFGDCTFRITRITTLCRVGTFALSRDLTTRIQHAENAHGAITRHELPHPSVQLDKNAR